MTDTYNYAIQNWDTILGILTGIVTVASLAANLIPGDKEDKYIGWLKKGVDWLALNFKPKK